MDKFQPNSTIKGHLDLATMYRTIWGAGSVKGVTTLLNEAAATVQSLHGDIAATWYSERILNITYSSIQFRIVRSSDGSSFAVDLPGENVSVADWNTAIDGFHLHIMEPIKDRTGGVATGVGIKSDHED